MNANLWVVAYDISSSKVRNQVADILKNHGQRVQYSVFECWLTRKQIQGLRAQIQEAIEKEDQVRWYPLCSWCAAKTTWQGEGSAPEDTRFSMI